MKSSQSILKELELTADDAAKAAIIADIAINTLPKDIVNIGRACAIFHWFDQDIIQALLPEETEMSAIDVFQRIQKFPFVEKLSWGLAYQDTVRHSLLERYKNKFKEELQNAAVKAAAGFLNKGSQISQIEAIYCLRVAGQIDEAGKLWEQLSVDVKAKEDGQLFSDIMELQQDAKFVTSIQSLYSVNNVETNSSWHLAHPYPISPNFTGRLFEREMLVRWLNGDTMHSLLILRALGGFGKSALSWHWLMHDVDAVQWPKVIWWSFYEGDASFQNFVKESLEYLGINISGSPRLKTDELIRALSSQKVLIVMDGFERALRAYSEADAVYQDDQGVGSGEYERQCIDINAEIFLKNICSLPLVKSKILLTTRLIPRAVEAKKRLLDGCLQLELGAMTKEDALNFFHVQGVRGMRSEIEAACERYGFHPLSLRILCGLIMNDLRANGDIALIKDFEITNDIVQNKRHILDVAYNTLTPGARRLLSGIACLRKPETYSSLKSIFDQASTKETKASAIHFQDFDSNLDLLKKYDLVYWDPKTDKYDVHPIVRNYAYARLSDQERLAIHARLRQYYVVIYGGPRRKLQTPDELASEIEKYYHTVQIGKFDDALRLYRFRIQEPLYYQFGAYETCVELLRALFLDGEEKLPSLADESSQAWVTNELAICYSWIGQPNRAIKLFMLVNSLLEKKNDKKNLALSLGNMAIHQLLTGAFRLAETNLHQAIDLCAQLRKKDYEATRRVYFASSLIFRGLYDEAEDELRKALILFETISSPKEWLSKVWMSRSQLFLLKGDAEQAIYCGEQALNFSLLEAKESFPLEKDFIKAHWLLGASYLTHRDFNLAEQHLSEALTRDRTINLVEMEADILLAMARLRYFQRKYDEAESLAEEALSITGRCSYVLQGADVNLFLAQYTLQRERGKDKAKEFAETALKLAYCDGPPYYYKVAYEEAERMLEKLK